MKTIKLFFAISLICCINGIFAQSPHAFNYQAIVRNSSGNVVQNQNVSFRLSILQGSSTGSSVYSEEQSATTNLFGLVNLAIGNGINPTGVFSTIAWGNNTYFIKVELDISGGTNYTEMGTNQLFSVPYALYSPGNYKAGSGINISNDTIFNTLPNQFVTLTNGNGISVTGTYPDFTINNTNPDQTITLNGTGATTVTGTYPDFTIHSIDTNTTYNAGTGLSLTGTTFNSVWTSNGNNIFNNNSSNVGIGTNSPTTAFHLNGTFRLTDDSEGAGKFLSSDILGNATWANPAISFSNGDTNYIPKFISQNSLGNSLLYQNGIRIGLGTNVPSGRLQIQADPTAADTEPLFEIKDKTGKTVMIVYQDSIHFFVKDDPSKTQNRGSFAVSGKSSSKAFTNNYLLINPDSTRIYTTDTIAGFGIKNIGSSTKNSYIQMSPINYFIGHDAGKSTSGLYNSFIGYQSGFSNITGYKNYFIGYRSGFNNINGYSNIFIGDSTGYSNTSGIYNIFIGNQCGYSNTIGGSNIFLGYQTGSNNIDGYRNVFIGTKAGLQNTSGYYNVFIGFYAGNSNTIGRYNSVFGYRSFDANISGDYNTSNGSWSLYFNTSGSYNSSFGYQSLYSNTTGNQNTSIGPGALHSNTTGSNNTAVGMYAFNNGTAFYNSTGLGYDAPVTASNMVALGNTSVTWIGGQVGWSTYSDSRFKKDIHENIPGLAFITKLRPVTYYMNMDALAEFLHTPDSLRLKESELLAGKMLRSGFIAQEVEKVANDLDFNFSGVCKPQNENDFYSLRYSEFTVPLVKAVQEQQEIIEKLKLENSQLKVEIQNIKTFIGMNK